MSTLTFRQARLIVMGFGTALIAGVALSAWLRGADLVEVGAIGLFLPVLVGLGYGRVRGGVATAVAVSAVYVITRFATLPAELSAREFIGAAVVRILLYVGLGLFGGWANEMLEHSLRKLELYDEIDDDTGVGNTRGLLIVADRELSRAQRYGSVFSLTILHLRRELFEGVSERQGLRALRHLAQTLDATVRTTDLVNRVPLPDREDLVIVLPETGREGARIFLERLVPNARAMLVDLGLPATNGEVSGTSISYPDDEERFEAYQQELATALVADTLEIEGEQP
ncbi:MAG: diguanylate cyclase [Actinobacteria bacterium]|nr:diguanylate cyclase [Actinomycetota bacterium]